MKMAISTGKAGTYGKIRRATLVSSEWDIWRAKVYGDQKKIVTKVNTTET
jgi:hypothetical protein